MHTLPKAQDLEYIEVSIPAFDKLMGDFII